MTNTKLNYNSTYHPQTNGQIERTNQVLEDMLRACALKHGRSWDKSLPYVEFSYNNGYQASLKLAPFEALYGRKCRTPLYWNQTGESQVFGPEILQEAEKQVQIIRENLKTAHGRSWDKSLPYVEFSYNNGYQASLKLAPFEALYGRKCRTPLYWNQTGESQVFGPEILQEAEKQVQIIRENLKTAQSRQKSYADNRRSELIFEVGDFLYLKVSPMRGMKRFKVKGKLSPRYIGPVKILERKGEVVYRLELPDSLSDVHDVFHVSQLKKCLRVPEEQLPMEASQDFGKKR